MPFHVPQDVQKEVGMSGEPPPANTAAEQRAAFKFYEELGQKLRSLGQRAFPLNASAPCQTHLQQCLVRPTRRGVAGADPTCMTAGGLPCIAYSRVGLLRKGSDPTEEAFQVWVSERKQWTLDGAEDMFFFENVTNFPVDKIREVLDETHLIVALPFTPKEPRVCIKFLLTNATHVLAASSK